MFGIVLYQPEIPPNTGNIIRLCANTGAQLHLVRPLGFSLDDAQLRRAGLDYHEYAELRVHDSLDQLRAERPRARWLALSTRGQTRYDAMRYQPDDLLLFGPETRGLPEEVLQALPPEQRLYLPQQPGVRSLNLSNAVAVTAYEAWRQLGYCGSAPRG
ncbi:MAG: tRNA (cytidine(34)-2'-O)-methyltransferase [Nevskia sp.]|nr:tRNA (cytidine(34)-2'-O)-methyltransferase [Nevskia sp.]